MRKLQVGLASALIAGVCVMTAGTARAEDHAQKTLKFQPHTIVVQAQSDAKSAPKVSASRKIAIMVMADKDSKSPQTMKVEIKGNQILLNGKPVGSISTTVHAAPHKKMQIHRVQIKKQVDEAKSMHQDVHRDVVKQLRAIEQELKKIRQLLEKMEQK